MQVITSKDAPTRFFVATVNFKTAVTTCSVILQMYADNGDALKIFSEFKTALEAFQRSSQSSWSRSCICEPQLLALLEAGSKVIDHLKEIHETTRANELAEVLELIIPEELSLALRSRKLALLQAMVSP